MNRSDDLQSTVHSLQFTVYRLGLQAELEVRLYPPIERRRIIRVPKSLSHQIFIALEVLKDVRIRRPWRRWGTAGAKSYDSGNQSNIRVLEKRKSAMGNVPLICKMHFLQI